MKTRPNFLFLCLCLSVALYAIMPVRGAMSQESITFPGYTWGQVRAPNSRQSEERNNEILQGAVHQGVDWWRYDKFTANSFIQFDFTRDTKKFDYNNKLQFSVGSQLKIVPADWVSINVGGKYVWDRRTVTNRTPKGAVGFISWYAAEEWGGIDNGGGSDPWPLGYSANTWGEFRYPSSLDVEERRNAIVQGAIQGVADLWRPNSVLMLSAIVGLDYVADRQRFDYNNELEPSVGMRLRLAVSDFGFIEIGSKYVYEYRFRSRRSETGAIFFLNWWASW